MKYYIYLDDVRTPIPNLSTHETPEWTVVRNYNEFVTKITEIGLDNIELISLDHDLGDTAMMEWQFNVARNFTLNYDNITEKTGMDCTKWLVEQWMNIIDGVLENIQDEELDDAKKLIKKYQDKLKKYRKCGLETKGELSYENLVFKILRRNGYIGKLLDAKNKIMDKKLSIENRDI